MAEAAHFYQSRINTRTNPFFQIGEAKGSFHMLYFGRVERIPDSFSALGLCFSGSPFRFAGREIRGKKRWNAARYTDGSPTHPVQRFPTRTSSFSQFINTENWNLDQVINHLIFTHSLVISPFDSGCQVSEINEATGKARSRLKYAKKR